MATAVQLVLGSRLRRGGAITLTLASMKIILLSIFLMAHATLAGTPTEAFKEFKKAAEANDFESAWTHVAKFDGIPDFITADLKKQVTDLINHSAKGWKCEILEEKIEGDCAVVVIVDSLTKGKTEIDVDPVYLMKQGDHWKVFPGLTQWEIAEDVAKDRVKTLKDLQVWYKARKEVIKKEIANKP